VIHRTIVEGQSDDMSGRHQPITLYMNMADYENARGHFTEPSATTRMSEQVSGARSILAPATATG
jgi:hypothetical protein